MVRQNVHVQPSTGKADDKSLLLPAIIYTTDSVLKGRIRSAAAGSLADVLNHRPDTLFSESAESFLPVFDVESLSVNGSRELMESTYVSKENILFAAQSRLQMVQQNRREKSNSSDEREEEEEVVVVAYVPSHLLVGRLAADTWRTLAHDLGCRQRFLSLSYVRVLCHSNEAETRYAMAAVNSSRILHITRLPGEDEMRRGQLTVDGILSELLGLRSGSAGKGAGHKMSPGAWPSRSDFD